jgi:hypothetical protein
MFSPVRRGEGCIYIDASAVGLGSAEERWYYLGEELQAEVFMQVLPFPTAAKRMAMLLCFVVALDAAAALVFARPVLWCAIIPGLLPILTPIVIFSRRVPTASRPN